MNADNNKLIEFFRDKGQNFKYSGNLSVNPLPRIFYFLKRDSRTGILSVSKGDEKKMVSFERGNPKYVVSNIVEECLGNILVAKGRLSEKECEESLELMKTWNKKQGETLVKMGIVEHHELDETLKLQARERVLELLGWKKGKYKFLEKKHLRSDLIPIDIDFPQMILLGIRKHYSLDELKKILANWMERYPAINDHSIFKIDDFKLASWETKTVRYFDTGKTLGEIVNQRNTREIDVYHLIYSFVSLDVMNFTEKVPELTAETMDEEITGEVENLYAKAEDAERKKDKKIELTKEFVVFEDEEYPRKKRFNFTLIAMIVAVIFAIIVIFMFLNSGKMNVSKFADENIIKSGKMIENVLVLKTSESWNIKNDRNETEKVLLDIYRKVRVDGIKWVKLNDAEGKSIGMVLAGPNNTYRVHVY